MIYAIILIVTAVAIFLIFRDDHDDSYNKSEKGPRKEPRAQYQKEAGGPKVGADAGPKTGAQTGAKAGPNSGAQTGPKAEPKAGPQADSKAGKKASGPSLKEQLLGQIEAAITEAKKNAEEPMKAFGVALDEAIGKARDAVTTAMSQAQQGSPMDDVDEQFQEEEADLDFSFLDDIDYSEDLEENTETFDIAGLKYHCTVYDVGRIVGIVQAEPTNSHDPRAQAVIRNDGKLLGYIPRTQLDWYEDFNELSVPCPFVGEIELDSQGSLIAEIKVIIPSSREFVEEEMAEGV